jgi:hypothetical protein
MREEADEDEGRDDGDGSGGTPIAEQRREYAHGDGDDENAPRGFRDRKHRRRGEPDDGERCTAGGSLEGGVHRVVVVVSHRAPQGLVPGRYGPARVAPGPFERGSSAAPMDVHDSGTAGEPIFTPF